MKVYLDNSGTTRVYESAIEAMVNIMRQDYGNPSSINRMGVDAEILIKEARQSISRKIKAKPEELYFTSGGTEANNLAIQGYLSNRGIGKHIITTQIEHPSVLNTFQYLESKGFRVTYLPVDASGCIDIKTFEASITSETSFVSMMYVNNELGVIQPVEAVGKILKKYKGQIIYHIDAIQAFGKLECNVKKLNCDIMSISSHKINGPKGVGALFIKKGTKVNPVFYGGGQEKSLRVGTENVPGIIGFSEAVNETYEQSQKQYEKVSSLRNHMVEQLKQSDLEIKINTVMDQSSPYVLNVSFIGIKGEILVHSLENKGIYVSTGSACSSKKRVNSHVLKAIGLDLFELEGAVRFSFGVFNTLEEIDYVINNLVTIVTELNSIIKGRV